TVRGEKIVLEKAVISGEKPPRVQPMGGLQPPGNGIRREFDGEIIWQNVEQFSGKAGEKSPSPLAVLFLRQRLPLEIAVEIGNAPFSPCFRGRAPAENVNGHGVEQFIRETNAAKFGNLVPGFHPTHLAIVIAGKGFELFLRTGE